MQQLRESVRKALSDQAIVDMHTHLYPPSFGTPAPGTAGKIDPAGLMLWGIDEVVTYHYLVAEVFRVVPPSRVPYEQFWKLPKSGQADHIWKHLFVERTPISEACRGVLTCMKQLGLDPAAKDLRDAQKWFAEQDPSKQIDRVMEVGNIKSITMTNNVFDDNERERWLQAAGGFTDPRFTAVLRFDPMLGDWDSAARLMSKWGYDVSDDPIPSAKTIEAAKNFLRDWIDRTRAIYVAVSLTPDWKYPTDGAGTAILEKVVLPVCLERNLPFAMMIGARRGANPALRDAADMLGESDVWSVVELCRAFPRNRFFVTMLARENQHALAIAARKFSNLMVFGCWWFLNNPSLIDEITRMRMELLGTSFIPQHSDARVLEQLLYKWDHSRTIIGNVLAEKYADMGNAGRPVTESDMHRDAKLFFEDNFANFLAG